jgi:hypothetical protein
METGSVSDHRKKEARRARKNYVAAHRPTRIPTALPCDEAVAGDGDALWPGVDGGRAAIHHLPPAISTSEMIV